MHAFVREIVFCNTSTTVLRPGLQKVKYWFTCLQYTQSLL